MWVLFCCAFFTCASRRCLSSGLFRLHRQPPYMLFSAILRFRRYESACLTCAFPPSSISAGTNSLAVHALSCHPSFPQVRIHSPYMHFHAILRFRRYESPRLTCVFPPFLISAGTNPPALHALSCHPSFPQVRIHLPYMRFHVILRFRRYNSSCLTCVFPPFLISAGTKHPPTQQWTGIISINIRFNLFRFH